MELQGVPLLRPQQVEELKLEKNRIEDALRDPRARLEDRQGAIRTVKGIDRQLATQVPKPFEGSTLDKAVERESNLREELTQGMLTQEEMRRNPPGAVGRHMAWEKKNKKRILEWKELRLRLNHDSNDPDIANLERFRPSTGGTLNLDNAQIPAKTRYFFPEHIEAKNIMSQEDRAKAIEEHRAILARLESEEQASAEVKTPRKKKEKKE